MAKRDLPDAEILRQFLRYEPDTGKLFWLERGREHFTSERIWKSWNGKNAGKEAFTYVDDYGYRKGRVSGLTIRAHIVIWAIVHGTVPSGVIDHINQDRADNRFCNLREVDKRTNHLNMGRNKRNTTGVTGVCLFRKRWQAMITVNYKSIYLGRFDTMEEALAARKAAESKYGFHENHGKG